MKNHQFSSPEIGKNSNGSIQPSPDQNNRGADNNGPSNFNPNNKINPSNFNAPNGTNIGYFQPNNNQSINNQLTKGNGLPEIQSTNISPSNPEKSINNNFRKEEIKPLLKIQPSHQENLNANNIKQQPHNPFKNDVFGGFNVKKGTIEFQDNFEQVNVDFNKNVGYSEWADFNNNFGKNEKPAEFPHF